MEDPVNKALVIGGGSFGTALALILARKGANVSVWVRQADQAENVNRARENVKYLPGTKLPENLVFTNIIDASITEGLELVIFAIPTQFLRPFLEEHRSTFPVCIPLLQSAKGIEIGTLKTPYDIMTDELPGKYGKYICVLAGPSFAKEMAAGLVTNVTVAAPDRDVCQRAQRMMSARAANFRCYASPDYMGCEIAGAVKNVLAIASGASHGLGLGLNARAALICRGLHEMTLLAKALGSNGAAMSGLAGVGDLLLTCSSEMSRNFTVGLRIAKGETLDQIMLNATSVAEGVTSARSVKELALSLGVEMPFVSQVYDVLYNNKSVVDALVYLQDRPLTAEN
jgi:glycerol-3-phosphate dehydrogenase